MFERLDVYDRKKTRTGKIIERKEGEILNKGEYIISVQCWIINNQGEILLTKRKLNKTHGGMWEPTNGLVISGEASKEAIKRELKEEIGLDIEENKITLIKEIVEENENMNFLEIYI
ncbi:MAG: NUDIX domain-containing protein [Clostridia bacterium]|nr:NUDIX domain-containing protein [Clostridium sp.]